MPYSEIQLRAIYDRTDGRCHLCHKRVAFIGYGSCSARGSWEVEHSRPRVYGGTDHGNNLKPSCIRCNRSKGSYTTRTARSWNGVSRAPLSKARKAALRDEYTTNGGIIGAAIGIAAGLPGIVAGAVIGTLIGSDIKPPKA
jgi:hypothetical protein